jgi:hypothetical protein
MKVYRNQIDAKGFFTMSAARLIRAISGILLVLQCLVLIAFFGVMPLLGYAVCPVDGSNSDSLYKDGSLAFIREAKAEDLKKGDVALYYMGRTAVGSTVVSNDANTSVVTVRTAGGTASVPYRMISGKGSGFSVPMLGSYADWLVHGDGLLSSVIILGAFFVVFAGAAFSVRDKD